MMVLRLEMYCRCHSRQCDGVVVRDEVPELGGPVHGGGDDTVPTRTEATTGHCTCV